ncbi:sensor histidine kinase [Myceligenerans salitolerans]|uniref:histidine kinase n=1 Tax=Myceligenerans salitolerans TaxID=1230528 RepID=A0ABS3IDC0_9MICO|nr:HAMP domain-containing sensor histidine kinase [Myceligenerans salitolerans]MBO0610943.1 HAMP domain-containing histidine kinase [Myceligenerans salitolerans]
MSEGQTVAFDVSADAATTDARTADATATDATTHASALGVPAATPPRRRSGLAEDVEAGRGGRPADWIAAVPLRARLVAITAFLLAAGLIITGLLARGIVGGYLVDQVDAQLEREAPALANAVVESVLNYETTKALPSDYYIEYRWTDGNVRTPRGEGAVEIYGIPDIPDLTYAETVERKGEPFTVRAVHGSEAATRWRVYPLVNPDNTDTSIPQSAFVALPLGRVDATLEFLSRTLIFAGLGIVLFGLALAWLMIERSLRQLREIETAAASIAAGDLSRRVPAPPPSTEVGSLAESLNSMLAQIETAFSAREASEARMRQFVSDASHELRTPLATIRGYGELYRMGALDGPDGPDGERVADTMGRVEDAARRMGTLVNDLLVLARLDEGRPIARAPVDVAVLARESAQDLHALDPSREVRVVGLSGGDGEGRGRAEGAGGTPYDGAERDGAERDGTKGDGDAAADPATPAVAGPVMTEGDDDRLRQVLTNLIGNVARHTPAGSPAEIAVGHGRDGQAVIEVRDHGPGVADEHARRIFERFYRADSSRNRESGGSGLGLAIVAAIVEAHGGDIEVDPTWGGGLTVRVTLPGTDP